MSLKNENRTNINYENSTISTIQKINDSQSKSYSAKTGTDFRRQTDVNIIYDSINNINWESEAAYHNSYRVNGKYNIGRTIKSKK